MLNKEYLIAIFKPKILIDRREDSALVENVGN